MSLKRKPATGVILNILVVCAMVVWIAPTLGLLTTSLRPERDALTTCWWTVLNSPLKITQYTLEDYRRVVSTQGLGAALRNSLVIASVSALVPVMVAAYAVFGFAHPAFRRNTAFFAALVGLVAVPLAMTFAPALRIHSRLGPSGSLSACGWSIQGMGFRSQCSCFAVSSVHCRVICLNPRTSMGRHR